MFLAFSTRYATTQDLLGRDEMALTSACHLTKAKTIKTDYSRKLVRREASLKHFKLSSGKFFSSLVNEQEHSEFQKDTQL